MKFTLAILHFCVWKRSFVCCR